MAAHQPPHPWDSPGKNTGVGCHFLLQCMKVKGESEVTQSCPTLSDPMDCSLPGSSVHGIFQARVLECGDIAFSKIRSSIPIKQQFPFPPSPQPLVTPVLLSVCMNLTTFNASCKWNRTVFVSFFDWFISLGGSQGSLMLRMWQDFLVL